MEKERCANSQTNGGNHKFCPLKCNHIHIAFYISLFYTFISPHIYNIFLTT